MSRVDEAWRRVTGAVEQPRQQPHGLERFGSERKPAKAEDPAPPWKAPRTEEPRIASFASTRREPADTPPVALRKPGLPAHGSAPPAIEPDGGAETDNLIDVRQIADYVGFTFRSLRRHKLLGAAAFAVVFATTAAAALLMPKSYYIEVKLLAQRNAVMTALSNPGRAVPWDADAPTRAAAETVLRRDNLISLVAETDLVKEWERTRVPILKFRDWLRSVILRHEPTADEKLDALLGTLESRMFVEAGPVGDGTVTIKLWWPDAEIGYRLVQAAQRAFLEARQIAETTAISESIGILERYSASLHQNINRALAELQSTQATRRGAAARTAAPIVARRGLTTPGEQAQGAAPGPLPIDPSLGFDTGLNRSKDEIAAKRQELSRLEETRRSQLADLQGKLAQLTTVYTPSHPNVIAVQQNINALLHESTQELNVRADLNDLETAYEKRSTEAAGELIRRELARRAAAAGDGTPTAGTEPEAPPPTPPPPAAVNETTELGTLLLRSELSQLESVLQRTDGARIELAVSQAAFKYRYTVIQPARVPRQPISPNLRLIMAAGLLSSLLMALFTVVCRDLLGNRILESWQIERTLGLPIVGTVTLE